MSGLGAVLRWVHLVAGVELVGVFVAVLLAGRADKPTARAWEARLLRAARWLAALALASGVAVLAHHVARVAGRAGAALEPGAWLTVLTETRFGTVWLVRHAVLALVAVLLLLREEERSRADRLAFRGQAALLAAGGLAAAAWAGHAASADALLRVPAAVIDALHLIAAGAWLGALLPLALLLRAAAAEAGADSRPYAVLAVRRFSAVALAAMAVLVVTGAAGAWLQLGDVAGLVGTPYGWLLLVKLALLLPVLVLAAVNRRRLVPRLGGPAATVGRPAMARLARQVVAECGLGLAMLAVVSVLSATPPGRHDTPWWPLAWRLDWTTLAEAPSARAQVLVGSQVAVLGAVVALVALLRRRALALGAAAAVVALGLAIGLPPMAIDAYPTTYRRSLVPYQALSVASGLALFREHCASCHGAGGQGDGPAGTGLPRRPADLTAPHTGQHTAGDLFWWVTHGIPRAGMPGFAARLSEEDRWDVINFLRALADAAEARMLAPAIEPDRPRIAAIDAAFSAGPGPARALKEFRGQRGVLLVLFTLPASHDRLVQLAQSYELLRALGVEIVAVPIGGGDRIVSRLGATNPPILYPVVTEGAAEIVTAYGLFRRTLSPEGLAPDPPMPPHMELLIDRNGYLRARWIPGAGGTGWANPTLIAAELQQLGRESPVAPPAEHVH